MRKELRLFSEHQFGEGSVMDCNAFSSEPPMGYLNKPVHLSSIFRAPQLPGVGDETFSMTLSDSRPEFN
ncbi:hypothetical protein NPIL_401791 [Nephila pilipes]|uniref:Uncharacterized protein n=1 Tax=Nephila pilipes TaxID=299642 RepID=A0A8X6R4Y4_NEPPI|nr:hypothetical protein NPIL_401791 [Nephila pilipes]